jgi:hypothetical protein
VPGEEAGDDAEEDRRERRPPRKLPSEMLHAPALNRSMRASVESGTAEDVSNRVPKAS